MKYDLRADVKSVLDSTGLTDPGEIADKVTESVPAHALRSALGDTMRDYVRKVMAEPRTFSPPNFRSADGQRSRDTHMTGAVGRSWKRTGIREGWQRQLQNRVHVGESAWKFLGDCTYDNLYAMASEREAIAAKNLAWSRHYHELAALLTEHDAATVRDLPTSVLANALGGVA